MRPPHRARTSGPVLFAVLLGMLVSVLTIPALHAQSDTDMNADNPYRLAVLWTSGDRDVALRAAFMYTLNAKARGWFDQVTLIVWGPSAELLARDQELQERVRAMDEVGVTLVACKACADGYGVSEALEGMGIDVKYMGEPLTEMLQGDWEVLTF